MHTYAYTQSPLIHTHTHTPQRDELMDVIRTELTASAFRFEWEWARVISGEEEALYAWIAVNSFMKTFSTKGIIRERFGDHTRTHGAIDLGGASIQIAFEPSNSILSHAFLLRLPSRLAYDLYTQVSVSIYEAIT